MATGSGKTFTAITFIYRLLKYAKAKRVLFLVDTKNLGEQAEQEFMSFVPNDDNRKFTELYGVQRLKSSYIASDSQVCISTIQRLYAILKGAELEESEEEEENYSSEEERTGKDVSYCTAELSDTEEENDYGGGSHPVPKMTVTCKKTGDTSSCYGNSRDSIKRACAQLTEGDCSCGTNFHVPPKEYLI